MVNLMKICENCGKEFSTEDGNDEMGNFHRRRYCFNCLSEQPRTVAPPPGKLLNCIVCGNPLKGTQRKYCSKKCKVHQLSSYAAQKDRGIERKIRLIQFAGGACVRCGYSKNLAALEFHHIDPEQKKFKLDTNHLANRTWESVLMEFEKTELLCSNCHSELHCPDMEMEILLEKYVSKELD
jgi:hypothetical protein